MTDMIFVTQPSMPSFEEYCEEIKKIWESHWMTNMGAEHIEFQQKLERSMGCPHVVFYTNRLHGSKIFLSADKQL